MGPVGNRAILTNPQDPSDLEEASVIPVDGPMLVKAGRPRGIVYQAVKTGDKHLEVLPQAHRALATRQAVCGTHLLGWRFIRRPSRR